MNNQLKGWLADNTVTTDNLEDKILILESAGSATLSDIFREMKAEDTGLREETIEHVVSLHNRVVARLLLNGYSVNTELFYAVAQFTGVVEGGVWNPKKNSVYINFTQGKGVRQESAQTSVKILGNKAEPAYILGSEDTTTRATDGTATAGRAYRLIGRQIKVWGTHPTVGIALTDSQGVETKIASDCLIVNNPSEVIILLPNDLADGVYELSLTTQFSGKTGGKGLKEPRVLNRPLTVGTDDSGDGDGGGVTDPTV